MSGLLRFALCSFVILIGAACGFTAGAMFATAFLVARAAGLAGGAEVLFYGLIGALAAGVATGFAAARLSVGMLSRAALVAGAVLAVLVVWVALRMQGTESVAISTAAPRPTTLPIAPDAP